MAKQFLAKKSSDTMASTISKVKQKLKQVKFRHLKAYLSDNLKSDPRNCTHNEITTSEKGEVGVCAYEGSNLYGNVCDVSFGRDLSQECGLFCPKRSKEELKKEFYEFIDKSPIGLVAKEFPDVTALIWVLNTLGADDSDMELEEHYEKIEQLTVENHELLTVVEDLKKMLILQTTEIQQSDSEKKYLIHQLSEKTSLLEQCELDKSQSILEKRELSSELENSMKTLSQERELSLWDRIARWFK